MQQLDRTRPNPGHARAHVLAQASQLAMWPRRWAAFGLLIALACAVIPICATAGNYSFMNNSPLSFMEPDDVALMKKNALEALDAGKLNAKHPWSNPKTGASGFAQITGEFTTADGTPCKRLRLFNKAGGMANVATYPVCKYSGRGWVINADARPAK
jgi:hypothetical protein